MNLNILPRGSDEVSEGLRVIWTMLGVVVLYSAAVVPVLTVWGLGLNIPSLRSTTLSIPSLGLSRNVFAGYL